MKLRYSRATASTTPDKVSRFAGVDDDEARALSSLFAGARKNYSILPTVSSDKTFKHVVGRPCFTARFSFLQCVRRWNGTIRKLLQFDPAQDRWSINSSTQSQRFAMFLIISSLGAVLLILFIQLHAYIAEYQGPLDHVTTSLQKPYFSMNCPDLSLREILDKAALSTTSPVDGKKYESVVSWDCNSVLGIDSDSGKNTPTFPHIFMMGARDETEDTFASWENMLQLNMTTQHPAQYRPQIQRIHTLGISNKYALSGGALRKPIAKDNDATISHAASTQSPQSKTPNNEFLCRKLNWEQRLFAVYQSVFQKILKDFPQDGGFVIVEDDALLRNPNGFVQEVCLAQHRQLGFYSLYRSPLQLSRWWASSCIYRHGTVAFYIQRTLMETIVNERRRGLFCRFPIDMYISKLGPWYATRRDVVGHLDSGRIGSF